MELEDYMGAILLGGIVIYVCICFVINCFGLYPDETNTDSDERVSSLKEYERSESQSTITTIQSPRTSMEHYSQDAQVDILSLQDRRLLGAR